MSTTNENASTAFIIDTSQDRLYPLFMSHIPDAHEFLDEIPLSNINWDALNALATPYSPTSEHEALLIPTDSARTISVVVGTHVVGTLPDPTVISHSQIARVYASGMIPTCTLRISPGDSILARVFLFKTGGGVPYNDPPEKPWTLLPTGTRWCVEPTCTSLFKDIPTGSQLLLELRDTDGLISVYINDAECGILEMEAADALAPAVRMATERNHLTLVQGCVHHEHQGEVFLHIDALEFTNWSQDDFALPTSPREKLIAHEQHPLAYMERFNEFIRQYESTHDLSRERRPSPLDWLQKTGPYVLMIVGFFHLLFALVLDELSARGLVGVLGLSFITISLGAWIIFCQQRDTPHRRQPRHWNFLIPISLSALIPSVVFANIGIFYDSPGAISQTSSVGMTTLRNFPDFPTDSLLGENPGSPTDSIPHPQQDQHSIPPLVDPSLEAPLNHITASDIGEFGSPAPDSAEPSPGPRHPRETDTESDESNGSEWTPPGITQTPSETPAAPIQELPFPVLPEDLEVEETTPTTPTSATDSSVTPEETPWHADIITPTDGIPIWGVSAPDDDPPRAAPLSTAPEETPPETPAPLLQNEDFPSSQLSAPDDGDPTETAAAPAENTAEQLL